MIRELTVQDTGTYQCGVDIQSWTDIYTLVELKVKEGPRVSRAVSAHAGGGVNIKCRYEDKYKDKIKSFCKIETDHSCLNQIRTKLNSEWSHDGRFSVHDDRSSGFFSVFIRELITEDTGTYACAVDVSDRIQTYTVMFLDVRKYLSYETSISETVHVGGDLNISCKYPESLRSNPKFLCKMRLQDSVCSYKKSINESGRYINVGKFSLYDDRERRILSVSIRNVTERDSGEYWCGAEAAWESDDGYKVYFTQINLTVTDPHVPITTWIPTQPSSSPPSQPSSSPPSPSSASSSSSSSSTLLLSKSTPVSPQAGNSAQMHITPII
ncbi:polymeric immunoglobulin receptor [Clarias gariepinus]